jgi:hypothetical protein
MSISADRMSTSLPLPSSPHCAPRTAVTGVGNKRLFGFLQWPPRHELSSEAGDYEKRLTAHRWRVLKNAGKFFFSIHHGRNKEGRDGERTVKLSFGRLSVGMQALSVSRGFTRFGWPRSHDGTVHWATSVDYTYTGVDEE